MKIRFAFTLLLMAATTFAIAQPQAQTNSVPKKKGNPALAPIKEDPQLPRVLLIGDSISIGYTLPVRELLSGKANVHRIPANGGPTTNGLANLTKWVGNRKWDVIHFNWGLHDMKYMADGTQMVPPPEYEKNLRELVSRLKATGAKLIWASTTPVPEGKLNPERRFTDAPIYNDIAKKIMDENGIAIDDLYAFAQPQLSKIQKPADVHFTTEGSRALAKAVAASIEKTLPGRK